MAIVTKELLEEVKQFAAVNYENGYDHIIECYSDAELEELLIQYGATTLEEFIKAESGYLERAAEIRATIW